ncbi:MAG: MBL fold metallo-hydrolase [Candidatus Aenigmarchaeota archaeon]|nr:MBL fold metallo-hydrolase [Candidatus Aenigmarchaeota archaeon]
MKIQFLGTAGGRFGVSKQIRASGGIYIESCGKKLYLDPGPGALVHARRNNIPLEELDAILLSHVHQDHTNDANVLIDILTKGGWEKKGILIGSKTALEGYENIEKAVLNHYLNFLEKIVVMEAGDTFNLDSLKITATPTKHGDPKGIGFVFEGEKTVSYVSDSYYFKGLEEHHKNSDILILNHIFPREESTAEKKNKYHTDSESAKTLIEKTKPELVITQHFGLTMMKAGPENEARWLEEETGVKVIAAKDFQVFEF